MYGALNGDVKFKWSPISKSAPVDNDAARTESFMKTIALAEVMDLHRKHLRIESVAYLFLPKSSAVMISMGQGLLLSGCDQIVIFFPNM